MLSDKLMRAVDILNDAYNEIVSLAADVGIDGHSLLQSLPASGHLLTGGSVPVLHKRYQSACYVLLYINQSSTGIEWPFLRLYTFKDGGHQRTFNGLRWLRQKGDISMSTKSVKFHAVVKKCLQSERNALQRLHRYRRLCSDYHESQRLPVDHPWLTVRLCGHADAALVSRTDIRVHGQRLLAPLRHHIHEMPGFHCVYLSCKPEKKRHYIREAGLLSGSHVLISAARWHMTKQPTPILICEGLATGLSLALVWDGEIRIALCADNLMAVRKAAPGPVIICGDNDQWNPGVGNVGLAKAESAMQVGDKLRYPEFNRTTATTTPTDFNDLLMQEGLVQLHTQLVHGTFIFHE